jgi:hypothetical protein
MKNTVGFGSKVSALGFMFPWLILGTVLDGRKVVSRNRREH